MPDADYEHPVTTVALPIGRVVSLLALGLVERLPVKRPTSAGKSFEEHLGAKALARLATAMILWVGACQAPREGAQAPRVTVDGSAARARASEDRSLDAASRPSESTSDAAPARELTVGEAKASLVVRDESLRLAGGGELAAPCVDWTRRVERLEYSEDPGNEDAEEADRAKAAIVPAERLAGAHFDLDGDGQDDASVRAGAADITTLHEVYVLRGGCGYSAGVVASVAGIQVLHHRSHGLFDLVTTESAAHSARIMYAVTYRFDGKRYHPVTRRRVHARDPRVEENAR